MKNWVAPKIETVSMSQTEYEVLVGTIEDGVYLNHEDCEEYTAYES